jgi:transglutaminase-like putative cysteine protease
MLIFKDESGRMPKEAFDYVESNWIAKAVSYVLDRNTRIAVSLVPWLEQQVSQPDHLLVEAAKEATKSVGNKENYDMLALACLKYVKNNVTYITDDKKWKVVERWQTAIETLTTKTGDCEDGAILIFVLCRLSGIPSNRLLIMCGDVTGGGHCYLGYKPMEYPLNWVFLDWCYWTTLKGIDARPKFYIQDQIIYGEDSRYKSIWFAFNDMKSYFGLRNPYAPQVKENGKSKK